MAFLLLVGSSAWADAGDVTKNADIDFSNAISDGAVAGTVNSMTIGATTNFNTEIASDESGQYLFLGDGINTVTIPSDQYAGKKDVVTIQFDMAIADGSNNHAAFYIQDADGGNIGYMKCALWSNGVANETNLGIAMDNTTFNKNGTNPKDALWNKRTSFTITLDYLNNTITTVTQIQGGTAKDPIVVTMTNKNPVAKFVVQAWPSAAAGGAARRAKFGNLLIKTTEGDYSVASANYTVNWVCGTIIKTDTRSGDIGATITLSPSDKETFFSEDKTAKYQYVSDNTKDLTIKDDGSTVVEIILSEVGKYTYSVVDNWGNTIASGEKFEDEAQMAYWSKYAKHEGKWYQANGEEYGMEFNNVDNEWTVNYSTESSIDYFFEAEGLTKSKAPATEASGVKYSAGKGVGHAANSSWYSDPLTEGGVYTLAIAGYARRSGGEDIGISIRDAEGNLTETGKSFKYDNAGTEQINKEVEGIEIPAGCSIALVQPNWNSTSYIDYITLTKTADLVQTYTVTISNEIENGTVVADPTSANAGAEVTLTNTPAEGYEFVSYSVTGVKSNEAVLVTDGKFTMPADDVTVSATFQLPAPATYAVTIAEGIEGGTVVADPTSAKAGDEVTLINTPAEGYEFVSYSVTGVHEELAVIVTDGKFTMPADDVTVSAEFKAVDPSGDEEVALAADMFYTWDGYGADASKIASATVDFKVGESVGAGTTVVGTGSVDYLTYADMTGSTKVIFEGTDGTVIRLLMNRQESNNGPLVEKNATIAEGKAEISLTDLTYVHVNAIKIPYNGSTGNIISSITFIKPNDPLAGPKEALKDAIAAAKMQNSVAKTEESFAALTKAISDGEAALADAQATVESLTTAKSDIETAVKGLTLAEGYAEVTKEMFKQYASVDEPGEGTTTGGAYELFTASDLPYGDSSVSELKWADLTKYDKLIVAVAGTTAPRFCMNRLVKEGQQAATQEDSKMIDINPNNDNTWSTEKYQTVENGVYTIDLATIVSDYGFARLHCIKKQGWGAGVVVTGMYLHEAPAYTVNIAAEIENGTVVADPTSAVAGEKVTLTATPAEGYTLASVSVTGVHEDLAVEVTDGKFTMPADDVTVNATFEKTPYSIEYALGMQNGTVTGPVSATADEKVTLTVTPAEGYELETLKVTCAVSGNEINYDVTDYSFTMPAEGVYVIATFQKKPVYIETDLTKDFEALTDVSKWTGASGYTDTQYCPAVTTNSGKTVQVCERYDPTCANTGDVFYQTVTGLTPGTYKIELYGGAAFTFGRGFGSMAFTGEIGTGDPWGTHVSETYQAGDKIEPSVENPTGVSLTATTSEGTYGGEIPIYYATNFPAGAAVVTLSGVKIGANGEIKIGMSKTSQSTNWHVIQLKGVTAQVRADVLLAKAVADAQGVAESDVPAKLYSEIQTAIETYDKEYSTADEYQTAINALNALVDKANGYVTLTAVLNEGDQYKANVPAEDPAIAAYDAAIADVKGAYDDAVVADIPAAVKVVEAALPALAKAQTAPGSDLTTLVNNTSWTCPQGNGPGKYQEIYTETYNESAYQPGKVIYQKIEGLIPGGVYEVKFLAVANTAWGKSNFGDGLAQVYANEVTSDISVIEQNNCNPTEYEQTLTAEVGDDGVFEYGMQNVAAGGNWYVVKGVSMTLKEVIISYSVDIAEGIENGTVEVSAKKAAAGEEVTITATPAEGYELVSVSVKGVKSDIAVQVVTDEVTGEMSFTMPNDAVVVSATFKEIAYPITYAIGMQNGTVEGPVESVAGEKVTLTVTPAEGYELENLTITCAESQNEINYDVVDYSFTMPKEGVYIIATFVQTTGIDAASAAKGKKIGVKKYFKNGELIIIGKDGKEFRANGAAK